ncbi:MAG: hypothetical protein GY771_12610 [bacterium]|nr:hypothetical protein [bacterium]
MKFYCYNCGSYPFNECGSSVHALDDIQVYVCDDCADVLTPAIVGWHFGYNMKPMPDRNHDWEATHKDYDGPPDTRSFTGPNIWDLFEQILDANDLETNDENED